MAGMTKERWMERRKRLLQLLPLRNWVVAPAAREAGYGVSIC